MNIFESVFFKSDDDDQGELGDDEGNGMSDGADRK